MAAHFFDTSRVEHAEPTGSIAIAIGPFVAVVVAGVLAPHRGDVGATNAALVLAMVVVLAALAGRISGIVTALVAAAAYNYFFTVPYHSLRISGTKDVVTVCLLALLGLMVSEIGAWRRRVAMSSDRRLHGAEALETTAALLAHGATVEEVWQVVAESLTVGLHLESVRYEPGPTTTQPLMPRSGSLAARSMQITREGFALPAAGVALPVTSADRVLGHVVMVPQPGTGSTIDARRVAVAMADQLAVAIAVHGQPQPLAAGRP